MTETKKLTKKEYFNILLGIEEVSANESLVDFINHELELLDRKSSKSGQTKTQKENQVLVEDLFNELVELGKAVSIKEFQAQSEKFGITAMSNQKVSALMKKLVDSERVTRTVDKKVAYFKAN